ncbi:MAG TPA: DUF3108 domain-containing protein [Stellaceae bacterium]|nr:DUF3108 domain-containing protein [Stellaceae bacterium]
MATLPFPLKPAIAGALLLAAIHPAAADGVVEMSFEGFGPAGLHLMTTHTTIEETAASYIIRGDFETAGLGALFVNVANRSVTQGRQAADTPHPVTFDSQTDRNGVLQHLRVDYRPDGMPSGSVTPPPQEAVTPIDTRQLTGTVDNLTAYLLLERQLGHGGGCALKVPVFDGRHRYDLRFSDAGRSVLSPVEGQKFSGPAQACRMVRDEIGGFYVDKQHEEGASAGTIWYAPQFLPGELAVPVRMKMDTEIGGVTVYLSQLRAKGVYLRLME